MLSSNDSSFVTITGKYSENIDCVEAKQILFEGGLRPTRMGKLRLRKTWVHDMRFKHHRQRIYDLPKVANIEGLYCVLKVTKGENHLCKPIE